MTAKKHKNTYLPVIKRKDLKSLKNYVGDVRIYQGIRIIKRSERTNERI